MHVQTVPCSIFLASNMSFLSKCHSAETLARGLELARSNSMSLEIDPEPDQMKKQLADLKDPVSSCPMVVYKTWFMVSGSFSVSFLDNPMVDNTSRACFTQELEKQLLASQPQPQRREPSSDDDVEVISIKEVGAWVGYIIYSNTLLLGWLWSYQNG